NQQPTPPRRANRRRNANPRGLAWQEAATQNRRPASTPPLPRRTHQRLVESETTDRDPPRPKSRQLPRLPPPRHAPHPREVILRPTPDPISVLGSDELRLDLSDQRVQRSTELVANLLVHQPPVGVEPLRRTAHGDLGVDNAGACCRENLAELGLRPDCAVHPGARADHNHRLPPKR